MPLLTSLSAQLRFPGSSELLGGFDQYTKLHATSESPDDYLQARHLRDSVKCCVVVLSSGECFCTGPRSAKGQGIRRARFMQFSEVSIRAGLGDQGRCGHERLQRTLGVPACDQVPNPGENRCRSFA